MESAALSAGKWRVAAVSCCSCWALFDICGQWTTQQLRPAEQSIKSNFCPKATVRRGRVSGRASAGDTVDPGCESLPFFAVGFSSVLGSFVPV
jgi:hypothetical protein